MSEVRARVANLDAKINFQSEFEKLKASNAKIQALQDTVNAELLHAKKEFGEKSVEYRFFERTVIQLLKKQNLTNEQLKEALWHAKQATKDRVQQEIDKLAKDTHITSQYEGFDLMKNPHIAAAKAINLNSSINKYLSQEDFTFRLISSKEREEIGKKPFSITQTESWKEVSLLLGEDIGNSIKDLILLITSIPSSTLALAEYIKIRKARNESIENEAKLKHLVDEFPALALADLVTDADKLLAVFETLKKELMSGTQGGVALAIGMLIGVIGWGAGLAKLGGKLSKARKLAKATKAAKASSIQAKPIAKGTNTPAKGAKGGPSNTTKTNTQTVSTPAKGTSTPPAKGGPKLIIENKWTQQSFKNLPDENAKYQMKNQQKIQDASKLGDPNINKLQPKQNSKGKSFENLSQNTANNLSQKSTKIHYKEANKLGETNINNPKNQKLTPKESTLNAVNQQRLARGELTSYQIDTLKSKGFTVSNRHEIQHTTFVGINNKPKSITLTYNNKTNAVEISIKNQKRELVKIDENTSTFQLSKMGIKDHEITEFKNGITQAKQNFLNEIQKAKTITRKEKYTNSTVIEMPKSHKIEGKNPKTKSEVATPNPVVAEAPPTNPKKRISKKTVGVWALILSGSYAAANMAKPSPETRLNTSSQTQNTTSPETPLTQIEENRKINGLTANRDYRERVNSRWVKYPMWKDAVTKWNAYYKDLDDNQKQQNQSINTMIELINSTHSYEYVQNLQRLLNMWAEDNATGQDGMLGKNTISALRNYIEWRVTSTEDQVNPVAQAKEISQKEWNDIFNNAASTPRTPAEAASEVKVDNPPPATVSTPETPVAAASEANTSNVPAWD